MNRDKVYFEYQFQEKLSSGVDVSGIYDYTWIFKKHNIKHLMTGPEGNS